MLYYFRDEIDTETFLNLAHLNNLDNVDIKGRTALHKAVIKGYINLARMFVEQTKINLNI